MHRRQKRAQPQPRSAERERHPALHLCLLLPTHLPVSKEATTRRQTPHLTSVRRSRPHMPESPQGCHRTRLKRQRETGRANLRPEAAPPEPGDDVRCTHRTTSGASGNALRMFDEDDDDVRP
ncbi:hypothetical protein EMCRGX_G025603 [Ephydatia muelleri]